MKRFHFGQFDVVMNKLAGIDLNIEKAKVAKVKKHPCCGCAAFNNALKCVNTKPVDCKLNKEK